MENCRLMKSFTEYTLRQLRPAFHSGSSIYNPLPQTEELPFSLHAHQ